MNDVNSAVLSQYKTNTTKKKPKVSDEERLKRYFSTNLPKNQDEGKKKFRILPPANGKSPFDEVWAHELKIADKWVKLFCPKKNKEGACPLCDVEAGLRATGLEEDKKIAGTYQARKFYIVKGIDRDLEADGPKFWRFRHNYKKQGILDKIVPIFSENDDITDPITGYDITLTLGKDDNNFTKVTSIVPAKQGPLSTDPELAKAWLENDTVWEDVYSKKPFDYLDIIAQGETPYWDKEGEKYVSKTEYDARNENGVSVETMDDDGKTTATIGGGSKKEVSNIQPEAEDNDEADEEMTDLPF